MVKCKKCGAIKKIPEDAVITYWFCYKDSSGRDCHTMNKNLR